MSEAEAAAMRRRVEHLENCLHDLRNQLQVALGQLAQIQLMLNTPFGSDN